MVLGGFRSFYVLVLRPIMLIVHFGICLGGLQNVAVQNACCFPPNSVGNIPKIHQLRYKYCYGLKVYTIEKTLLRNIVCFRGFLSGYQHLKG